MGNKNSSNKKLDFSEGTETQENNETCLISPEKLKYLDFLGHGSFGVVFRAKWEKSNGQVIECAVKTLRDISTCAEMDALKEIRNMEMLSDANVVKLYGIAVRPHIQVVVEFCDGGALVHRLRDKNKSILLVTQLLDYSKQLCSGMMYLESQRCVHRDLAARNVLLTNREKVVKIADFGLTHFLSMDELYYKTHNSAIPYQWCPPEAIRDKKFCHKSDVWAFGVTMWEMFTYGSSPWANIDANDIISSIESGIRLDKPISALSELYDVMLSCWEIQKHRRPPFEAIHRMLKYMSFTVCKCYKNHWFADDSDKLNINKRERVIIIDDRKLINFSD